MNRRVLVARLDSLGDVLVCGPAVRAVAAGARRVIMLCGPEGAPAARMLPGVDRVFTWQCPWILDGGPAASPEQLGLLQDFLAEEAVDQAVVFTSFHQSPLPLALVLRLAGVSLIAAASVDFAGSLLDVRLKPGEDFPEDIPEPIRALTIAEAAGFGLPADDDGRLAVSSIPALPSEVPDGPYVVVHPGASVPAREWPAGRHRTAVELLVSSGYRVVVTGGPSDTTLTRYVAGGCGIDLGGRTSIGALAAVLAGAQVVVTGNTGPAHLAAAVRTPVVSLFSPVVPASRWAPYGVRTELLGDQGAACRNSRARVCPLPGHPCLASVTALDVVEAVERILAEPPPDTPVGSGLSARKAAP